MKKRNYVFDVTETKFGLMKVAATSEEEASELIEAILEEHGMTNEEDPEHDYYAELVGEEGLN